MVVQNETIKEEWKPVFVDGKYYHNYLVSSFGKIKSIKTDKVHKGWFRAPYGVIIYLNSNEKKVKLSKIVADTFIPNPDKCFHISFKDGNILNCNVNNLLWSPFSTTMQTFDENTRKQACDLYINSKFSLDYVAEKHGTTRGNLKVWLKKYGYGDKIRTNAGWRDHKKIDAIVEEYFNKDISVNDLAKKYGICSRIIPQYVKSRGKEIIGVI